MVCFSILGKFLIHLEGLSEYTVTERVGFLPSEMGDEVLCSKVVERLTLG